MTRPLLIDLFCGSFGWSQGWLELGGRSIGFDLEHHDYHGPVPQGADLVLQDVRTIDGAQFKDASLILASSPCQEFSYRAMPWKRAKTIGPPLLGLELFAQAFRIQREAIAAAGRFIPMVQENVRGANPWVMKEFGRSRWSYGSYHLWGDVPALMPITLRATKVPGFAGFDGGVGFNVAAVRAMKADDSVKVGGRTGARVSQVGNGVCPLCRSPLNASGRWCLKCRNAYSRGHRVRHSLKTPEQKARANARSYANVYIRRGKITRKPCELCGDRAQMHHDDYSKPTDVRWLCRKHHREHHAKESLATS